MTASLKHQDGELNLGVLKRKELNTFVNKMASQGYEVIKESWNDCFGTRPPAWDEFKYRFVKDDREVFLFCLVDNSWVLIED